MKIRVGKVRVGGYITGVTHPYSAHGWDRLRVGHISFTGGIITGGNLQLTGGRKLLRAANNTGGINISELRLTGGIKQKKKYGWDRLRVG